MSKLIHVILSGGVGSRLWPVSRKSMPKQYIPMFGDKSLFQLTAERSMLSVDSTLVVGNKDNYLLSQADMMRAGVTDFTEIVEAAPRNTAAAIAFAAFAVQPDDILLVTPSDHIITDERAYADAIAEAVTLAEQDYLVTFGITPAKPETGYGYIEYSGNTVLSFREKPNEQTAQMFIDSGNFLWNSGMFCFRAGVYLEELNRYEPDILQTALTCYENQTEGLLPENETMQIPSKSIDYAVMERSEKIKVVQANFGWSDLGSFESIWEHWEGQGEIHRFKDNNCVVGSDKHVEFLGVSNIVLVETNDAILVLAKSSSQDVKKIYERLEREKPELVN
ncbi:sugar phosphate nucleotidyltransferase [Dyadobacter chenwenxiniae]|uniref:NTP transferase domain-containing protein n=1 Tax=Dyadobacter chenwenxiniae TaxID=2906456 RepID=A0A9X1TE90_9BACT|nr:sugar phosphate nucleotidyltransferase [Dyadobacter chenwenxiniae]MCF0062711.1 NTP transferase domain-containing protein [Dyadobacter chenwenxiniae]UON83544.1 sugar phosphate nucleotidyltransferase [Dyadobacter chenwenxiniae]